MQLVFLANAVTSHLRSDAKSAARFRAVSPMFNGVAPLTKIALGRIDHLERWIEDALQSLGNYPG